MGSTTFVVALPVGFAVTLLTVFGAVLATTLTTPLGLTTLLTGFFAATNGFLAMGLALDLLLPLIGVLTTAFAGVLALGLALGLTTAFPVGFFGLDRIFFCAAFAAGFIDLVAGFAGCLATAFFTTAALMGFLDLVVGIDWRLLTILLGDASTTLALTVGKYPNFVKLHCKSLNYNNNFFGSLTL